MAFKYFKVQAFLRQEILCSLLAFLICPDTRTSHFALVASYLVYLIVKFMFYFYVSVQINFKDFY